MTTELKTAEEWVPMLAKNGILLESDIRLIQANALRWAADTIETSSEPLPIACTQLRIRADFFEHVGTKADLLEQESKTIPYPPVIRRNKRVVLVVVK
jgi:hypothetical protein